jgi:hypothetical protein
MKHLPRASGADPGPLPEEGERDGCGAAVRRLSDLARAFIDGTEPLTTPDPGHSPRSSGRARGAPGGR